jgi:ppGpp synthetase/RelA/SpoT-type nucleotidyltranferase
MGYNQSRNSALNESTPLAIRYLNLLRCITRICKLKNQKFEDVLFDLDSGFKKEISQKDASKKIISAISILEKKRANNALPFNFDSTVSLNERKPFYQRLKNQLKALYSKKHNRGISPLTKRQIRKAYQKKYNEVFPIINEHSKKLSWLLEVKLRHLESKMAFPPQFRHKEWRSVVDKIELMNSRINCVTDIQDLLGFRVVAVFEKDIFNITRVIERNFKVVRTYKPDYMKGIANDSSQHIVIKTYAKDCAKPKHEKPIKFLVEIQVMTLAQFTFAKASHSLLYKKNARANKSITRSLQRTSTLLESVEIELSSNFNKDDH